MSRDNLRYGSVVFTLVLHLFRRYLVQTNKTTEEALTVTLREFYEFLLAESDLFFDRDELTGTYSVTEEELENLAELLQDPFNYVAALFTMWPMVVHSCAPPNQHVPTMVHLTTSVVWPDKMITMPLAVTLPPCPNADGYVVGLWRNMVADNIRAFLAAGGSDGLYAVAEDCKLAQDIDVEELVQFGTSLATKDEDCEEDSELDDL